MRQMLKSRTTSPSQILRPPPLPTSQPARICPLLHPNLLRKNPKTLAPRRHASRLSAWTAPSSSTRLDLRRSAFDLRLCLHHRKIVLDGQIEIVVGQFQRRFAEQAVVADLLQKIAGLAA